MFQADVLSVNSCVRRGGAAPEKQAQFALPATTEEVLRRFHIVENQASFEARFNHLYVHSNAISEEIKERSHLGIAFVRPCLDSHPLPFVENHNSSGKIKAMIKVCVPYLPV